MRHALLLAISGCAAHAQPEPAPVAPPPPIACTAVAMHVGALFGPGTDHAFRVHDVVLARCVEDAWPEPAKHCFLGEAELHGGRRCQDRLATPARAALVRGLDGARWPAIDPTRDPCEVLHDLATRIDSCTAVDTATRDAIRERTGRVALEAFTRGPQGERVTELSGQPAERSLGSSRGHDGPRAVAPVIARRRDPALQPGLVDRLLAPDDSPVAAECRGDVDALVKLGAERCGW